MAWASRQNERKENEKGIPMLRRLAVLTSLVAGSAFATEQAETSLQVIQSAEVAIGLPRVLQLAHADMLFCEDGAAAKELESNLPERTTVRAKAIRLATQAGFNLVPGLIEGTVDAIEHASINGYLSALQRAPMTSESKKRFCDAARTRLEEARQFRKEYGPTMAPDVRTLSSAAKEIEDFSRRLLSVYVDETGGEPLKTVVRKPAELEHCGAPADALNKARQTRDRELASLKNIFAEELQAEPNWPHGWLVAAQVHVLFAYANGYSTGVMNTLQALDEKERSKACKHAK
jgi:hypothetical protein